MTFEEGDRVRHKTEGVMGKVVSTDYGTKMKVEWDDGYETLETFHTVNLVFEKDL